MTDLTAKLMKGHPSAKFLEGLSEFKGFGDVVEYLPGSPGSYNCYDTVIQDPAHDRLVDVYGFYFGKVHLECSSGDETGFNDYPPVCNYKFRHRPLNQGSDCECEERFQCKKYYPVKPGFEYHRFIPDQVVVNVSSHYLIEIELFFCIMSVVMVQI